jgi:hypothetical protein
MDFLHNPLKFQNQSTLPGGDDKGDGTGDKCIGDGAAKAPVF